MDTKYVWSEGIHSDNKLPTNSTIKKVNDSKTDLQLIAEALSQFELQQKALDIKITGKMDYRQSYRKYRRELVKIWVLGQDLNVKIWIT